MCVEVKGLNKYRK